MTVDKAIATITKIINNTLEEYDQSPASKDSNGARIPHPLDIVDEDDKLFALDMALKNVALQTTPVSLIEGEGSTASELRRVSKNYFIRVPADPVLGQELDIDDGLAYAVIFKALVDLWEEYSDYGQQGDMIIATYDHAYTDYIKALEDGTISNGNEAYIRFSADGTNWHDSFAQGDVYISFKRIDTDTWTTPIRFVGTDGQDGAPGTPCSDTRFVALQDTPASYTGMAGKIVVVNADESGVEFGDAPASSGGASAFTDLSDTPSSLTAGKMFQVNSDGTAIVEVDPPSGGGAVTEFGNNTFFDDQTTGTISLDAKTYNSFYLYPSDDLTISFTKFDDDGTQVSAYFGVTYTFAIVNGGNLNIAFDSNEKFYGDATIDGETDTNLSPITIIRAYYDGYSWIVVDRVVQTDYQP